MPALLLPRPVRSRVPRASELLGIRATLDEAPAWADRLEQWAVDARAQLDQDQD